MATTGTTEINEQRLVVPHYLGDIPIVTKLWIIGGQHGAETTKYRIEDGRCIQVGGPESFEDDNFSAYHGNDFESEIVSVVPCEAGVMVTSKITEYKTDA